MKPVRLGVIGCGVIGRTYLKAGSLSSLVEIAAVADLHGETAAKVAEEFSIPACTADPAELIGRADLDAVVLAVPTCSRFALAQEALKAGKHVLLEKPAAFHAGELEILKTLSEGKTVACASARFRGTPVGIETARLFRQDVVGPLRMIQVRAIWPALVPPKKPLPAWRWSRSLNGGGVLVNWGVYDLDFLLGILGWKPDPVEVSANVWYVPPPLSSWVPEHSDGEAHIKALVRFAGGLVLDYERAELYGGKEEAAWRAVGEHGVVDIPLLGGPGSAITRNKLTADGLVEEKLWEQGTATPDLSGIILEDFAGAIIERRPPLTGLDEAIRLTQLTDLIYHSAKLHRTVRKEELFP